MTETKIARRDFHCLALGALAFTLGCTRAAAFPVEEIKDMPKIDLKYLVDANNQFAAKLFKQISSGSEGENTFFSPFSIEAALLMTGEGARVQTLLQMGDALALPQELSRDQINRPWDLMPLHAELRSISQGYAPKSDARSEAIRTEVASLRKQLAKANEKSESLAKANKYDQIQKSQREASVLADRINTLAPQVDQYILQVANAVWVEKTFPLNQEFLGVIKEYYASGGAFNVDFKGAPEAQRKEINDWIADHTGDKIKDIVPQGLIDSMTRMVLANAIYFKGSWATVFDKSQTLDRPFSVTSQKTITIPMMNRYCDDAMYGAINADGSRFETPATQPENAPADYGYPKEGYQVIELPYKGGQLSMMVILPVKRNSLPKMDELLSADFFKKAADSMSGREFSLALPKFKFETKYRMKEILSAMGMTVPFSDNADFSGLTADASPENRLKIAEVLHNAFVEVNEEGTEAAAATVVLLAPTSAAIREVPFTPVFNADHPFLFTIRDRETGLILFAGKVEDPSAG